MPFLQGGQGNSDCVVQSLLDQMNSNAGARAEKNASPPHIHSADSGENACEMSVTTVKEVFTNLILAGV